MSFPVPSALAAVFDYSQRLDARDFRGLSELFVPDGILRTAIPEGELLGRAAIESGMRSSALSKGAHYIGALEYRELSGQVHGRAEFIAVSSGSAETKHIFAGSYHDRLVHDEKADSWRFLERTIRLTWGPVEIDPEDSAS